MIGENVLTGMENEPLPEPLLEAEGRTDVFAALALRALMPVADDTFVLLPAVLLVLLNIGSFNSFGFCFSG